jgi:hypothetical protein
MIYPGPFSLTKAGIKVSCLLRFTQSLTGVGHSKSSAPQRQESAEATWCSNHRKIMMTKTGIDSREFVRQNQMPNSQLGSGNGSILDRWKNRKFRGTSGFLFVDLDLSSADSGAFSQVWVDFCELCSYAC